MNGGTFHPFWGVVGSLVIAALGVADDRYKLGEIFLFVFLRDRVVGGYFTFLSTSMKGSEDKDQVAARNIPRRQPAALFRLCHEIACQNCQRRVSYHLHFA